jgi:hypothetical protein
VRRGWSFTNALRRRASENCGMFRLARVWIVRLTSWEMSGERGRGPGSDAIHFSTNSHFGNGFEEARIVVFLTHASRLDYTTCLIFIR